jgi:hypothetical protein
MKLQMTSATVVLNTGVEGMHDKTYSVPITYSHILQEPNDNRIRDFYEADIKSQHELRGLSLDNCPSDLHALCSV